MISGSRGSRSTSPSVSGWRPTPKPVPNGPRRSWPTQTNVFTRPSATAVTGSGTDAHSSLPQVRSDLHRGGSILRPRRLYARGDGRSAQGGTDPAPSELRGAGRGPRGEHPRRALRRGEEARRRGDELRLPRHRQDQRDEGGGEGALAQTLRRSAVGRAAQ